MEKKNLNSLFIYQKTLNSKIYTPICKLICITMSRVYRGKRKLNKKERICSKATLKIEVEGYMT